MSTDVSGVAMIDGLMSPLSEAGIPVTDVGFSHGYSVFETLIAGEGRDVTPNLLRLRRSAEDTLIPFPPEDLLRAEIAATQQEIGARALVRVTLTGEGRRVVVATPLDLARLHAPVRCASAPHVDQALLPGSVKHRSRIGWMVAVRRAGVDEVLLVDAAGRLTEGTSCATLAICDGALWTAPWDGRILASTTLGRILAICERLSVPIRREGPPLLGPFDALYVASTTRSIAPVVEIDGRSLPGWDPIGRRLAREEGLRDPDGVL